jgi:predicted  nucleic acid-binding Zn-ribbon protein
VTDEEMARLAAVIQGAVAGALAPLTAEVATLRADLAKRLDLVDKRLALVEMQGDRTAREVRELRLHVERLEEVIIRGRAEDKVDVASLERRVDALEEQIRKASAK